MLYANETAIEKPSAKLLAKVRKFMNNGTGGIEMLNVTNTQTCYEFTPFKDDNGIEDFSGGWCVAPSGYFTHYIERGGNVKKYKSN